jgi:hypothetical protein
LQTNSSFTKFCSARIKMEENARKAETILLSYSIMSVGKITTLLIAEVIKSNQLWPENNRS